MKSFDRNVDYVKIKQELLNEIYNIINFTDETKFIRIVYIIICLIQLRNGSRISEAIKCFRSFVDDSTKYKFEIDLSKRRNNKTTRDFNIPEFIDTNILHLAICLTTNDILTDDLNVVASRIRKYIYVYHNKINTHSLRYAYINWLLTDNKVNINNVAKIVGHTTVNHIVRYTQNKKSKEILDKFY
jgi:integrase